METLLIMLALAGLFVLFALWHRPNCDGSGGCGGSSCGTKRCTEKE
jgi:hypothetical protein